MKRFSTVLAAALMLAVSPAYAQDRTPVFSAIETIDLPQAIRLDPPVAPEAPSWSRCPGLYAAAIEGWPNAEEVWYRLDFITWRESRCSRTALNRFGCAGIMQVCTGNFRRLGVTRYDLFDPVTSFRAGYRLCQEQRAQGRSCWRPWWTRGWRP